MARYAALIPAAGSGTRFGDEMPKQYRDLIGRPLLAHSIDVLAGHPRISGVSVVVSPDDVWFRSYDWPAHDVSLQFLPVGGRTRAQSVENGLKALAKNVGPDDWVLVHDAARPCLSATLLDRLIDSVGDDEIGGLLAMRVADTLKLGDEHGRVSATRSRAGLWAAQTPQMFRRGLLEQALSASRDIEITDEASAVEALGHQPMLIQSTADNLKVTYPDDFVLAETILRARQTRARETMRGRSG